VSKTASETASETAGLTVRGLSARYGHVQVLRDVEVEVAPATVTVVLGANGAGKTTLLRAISGMVDREGTIAFGGVRLDRMRTDAIARLGIAHVPEGRGTFPNLTTEQNLALGLHASADGRAGASRIDRIYQWFPRLAQRRGQRAGTLSGGEQQMLAIGRALVSSPRLMLLDEPSFGLAPQLVEELYGIVRDIRAREHVTMLLVEQNASLALQLADRVYVFEAGRVAVSGPPAKLRGDPSLRRAYLGY
jgi:branched-chain amino acid transport system ATP-binding protein